MTQCVRHALVRAHSDSSWRKPVGRLSLLRLPNEELKVLPAWQGISLAGYLNGRDLDLEQKRHVRQHQSE